MVVVSGVIRDYDYESMSLKAPLRSWMVEDTEQDPRPLGHYLNGRSLLSGW